MATYPAPIQLSPSVFLYQEDASLKETHQEGQNGPRLVILATWVFAQDKHIVKYIDKYRALFPNASILVVKSFPRHFSWIPGARKELEPAAVAIRGLLSADDQTGTSASRPPMLVHLFSNSGLGTIYNLCDAYSGTKEREKTNPRDRLPLHATIFDSSPGTYEYWPLASAVMFGVPRGKWLARIMATPLAHLLSMCLWVWVRVLGGVDWLRVWGQAANNRTRSVETCRSYVFSAADPLVRKDAVQANAKDALVEGFHVLYQEDFGNSKHAAHARSDPDRYWRVVRDTWDGCKSGEE
uniref:Indole-diterpene biosynthesis protein PaxU n=1 Tax=Bionectria ochroleuca TaxID=29856 RepID=A0A8H7N2K7_BIOOC